MVLEELTYPANIGIAFINQQGLRQDNTGSQPVVIEPGSPPVEMIHSIKKKASRTNPVVNCKYVWGVLTERGRERMELGNQTVPERDASKLQLRRLLDQLIRSHPDSSNAWRTGTSVKGGQGRRPLHPRVQMEQRSSQSFR